MEDLVEEAEALPLPQDLGRTSRDFVVAAFCHYLDLPTQGCQQLPSRAVGLQGEAAEKVEAVLGLHGALQKEPAEL